MKEIPPDDPNFLDKCRLENEARNRFKYLKYKETQKKETIEKSKKTRLRNRQIKEQVAKEIEAGKCDDLSFLPFEYRDPTRKIGIKEFMNLLEQHQEPKQKEIIEKLFNERNNKK